MAHQYEPTFHDVAEELGELLDGHALDLLVRMVRDYDALDQLLTDTIKESDRHEHTSEQLEYRLDHIYRVYDMTTTGYRDLADLMAAIQESVA